MRGRRFHPFLAAVVLAGCGGASGEGPRAFPPAAEPARAPAPARPPAGRVVSVGHKPEGIAVAARAGLVAVGLSEPSRLALVDVRSGRVRRRVELPGAPRHLSVAGPDGPVLVPAEGANALVEVPLRGGRPRVAAVGRQPHDAVATGGRVFVGDELGDSLSIVAGDRRVMRVGAPLQPGGVAATGDGRVAVVGVRERALELYDAATGRSLAKAPAGIGSTHVASDGKTLLYVCDTQGDALLVFHTRPRLELARRLALPGSPYGIALDAVHHRLWVTLTARNEVVELPAYGRPGVVATFPTVRQPNSVGVDPRSGRVFVASRTDGTLQLIDP